MTTRLLLALGAASLVALAGSVAFAKGDGGYMCQAFNPAKAGPAVTYCITWTREAATRMHAAPCDPAMMVGAAMRAKCAELMAVPKQPGTPNPG